MHVMWADDEFFEGVLRYGRCCSSEYGFGRVVEMIAWWQCADGCHALTPCPVHLLGHLRYCPFLLAVVVEGDAEALAALQKEAAKPNTDFLWSQCTALHMLYESRSGVRWWMGGGVV